MEASFGGTAAWLRGQWSNPSDIFTILLIIGGDIIQAAIAQLCAGPIPHLTPVCFSFGWVAYSISAMRHALGENRLMPPPELDCLLINAETGYSRKIHSWILSRLLRDFDSWRPPQCDEIRNEKLRQLQSMDGPPKVARIGLRVTVLRCISTSSQGWGDLIYWAGLLVSAVQLGIAAIPWAIYHDEWFTFLVTAIGTILAYASGALPQWADEKSGVRRLKMPKKVFLTEGNGTPEVLLIIAGPGNLDFEALAAPQRELPRPRLNRILSILLAILWVAFLITVAGWDQHSWYLVGVGMIGILHNVAVAGIPRLPPAWGLDLQYHDTIVEAKVMEVFCNLEEKYPGSGAALLPEFFPGRLFPREKLLWEYAGRRLDAWNDSKRPTNTDGVVKAWPMPPLRRPAELSNDGDIPIEGPYVSVAEGHATTDPSTTPLNARTKNADAVITIAD